MALEVAPSRFKVFYLKELFVDQKLVVNLLAKGDCIVTLQNAEGNIEEQQVFTVSETGLLFSLLENYPHYCPYEVMYARFYHGNASETAVERARQVLYRAQDDGDWDAAMRPIRNVLSRVRLKSRVLGVNIVSLLDTGYVLHKLKQSYAHAHAASDEKVLVASH